MNKLMYSLVAATAVLVGCTTIPDVDKSYKIGSSIGYTTAYVLNNQVKPDNSTRDTIIKVTTEVQKYVPGSNETFTVAWTPILNKFVDAGIQSGDLTEAQGERVKKDFKYITTLLDSYVEKKGIKQYQDCIDALVDGFCTKFLQNFKPANSFSANSDVDVDMIDPYAYGYLTAAFQN